MARGLSRSDQRKPPHGQSRILDAVPQPCAYFSYRLAGKVISTALCVADGAFAAVECMATRAEARRQGGADAVLRTLEVWGGGPGVKNLALKAVAIKTPPSSPLYNLVFAAVAPIRFC